VVKRALKQRDTLAIASGHRQKVWSEAKVKPCSPPKRGKAWQNQALSVVVEGVCDMWLVVANAYNQTELEFKSKSPVHNFVSYIVFYAQNMHNYAIFHLQVSDLRYPQY